MEDEEDQKELQLLPAPHKSITTSSSSSPATIMRPPSDNNSFLKLRPSTDPQLDGPSLDLKLSIPPPPPIRPINNVVNVVEGHPPPQQLLGGGGGGVQALKWQAAEQIWLAAIEKAYAERMRELSRREMELAQTEFAHARSLRERAKEEIEKAEKLKREHAANTTTCMEITCHSCRQKFQS